MMFLRSISADSSRAMNGGERTMNGAVGNGIPHSPPTIADTSSDFKAVVTINLTSGDEAGKQKAKTDDNRADYSRLLSSTYGLLLILIGLLFPMIEALRDEWLMTAYNMVYSVYTLTMSTIFIIYLQWLIVHQHRHHGTDDADSTCDETPPGDKRRKSMTFDAATVRQTEHGILIEDADAKDKQSKQNAVTRYAKGFGGTKTGNTGNTGVSAKIVRVESSANLQAPCSDDISQSEYSMTITDTTNEYWIDLSKLGNIFSHEGSNLYLRLWELMFALGNVVYIAIEIQYQMGSNSGDCAGKYGWTFIFRLVFLLIQTFFLFKNPTMHVKHHEGIVRFALMHLIATNMGVWLRTLTNEIMNEYEHLAGSDETNKSAECEEFMSIVLDTSPYLFPFVLEYSLIAMATMAVMYAEVDSGDDEQQQTLRSLQNLFRVQALEKSSMSNKKRPSKHGNRIDGAAHDESRARLLTKSHRGFYLGVVVLSGGFIAIMMFYFTAEDTKPLIYVGSDICLHSIMLVAAVIALINLHQLSYIARPVSVDDMLLLISVSGAVFYELALMMSSGDFIVNNHSEPAAPDGGANHTEVSHRSAEVAPFVSTSSSSESTTLIESLRLADAIISAVQAMLQVLMTISALRRYPSKQRHLSAMPGRGTITFLIVANVTVWVCRTSMVKVVSMNTMTSYYGVITWLLIVNINLPLCLFFRFHSSVCLADIWTTAYTSPIRRHVSSSAKDGRSAGGGVDGGCAPAADESAKKVGVSTLLRSYSMPQLNAGGRSRSRTGSSLMLNVPSIHIQDVDEVSEEYSIEDEHYNTVGASPGWKRDSLQNKFMQNGMLRSQRQGGDASQTIF